VPVQDAESAAELMARAAEARACEATAMNAVSSRSHCVFMLYIAASHAATNTNLTGSLCLVDLAGRCGDGTFRWQRGRTGVFVGNGQHLLHNCLFGFLACSCMHCRLSCSRYVPAGTQCSKSAWWWALQGLVLQSSDKS